MNRLPIVAALLLLMWLPACASNEELEPEAPAATATSAVAPINTLLPGTSNVAPTYTPLPEGYPTLATPRPPSGYPGATDPPLLPPGYPNEGELWIVRAAGAQCEDALIYPDIESAEAALLDAGVTVLDLELVELMVCSACGCPTSEHYRARINASDLAAALAIQWTVEQN
jgi:hypothetical protein